MVFSVILLAPSWGGMINGIMTLSGAWHKLRTDPILKFLIVSLSFYGMSTFEGPMMSIKTVNCARTRHRLGHRPRALRRARLGGLHDHRLDVRADPEAVRPQGNVERATDRRAFLDRHHRRRAVRDGDVDRGRHAGADVARHQRRRNADLYVRRVAEGDLSVSTRCVSPGGCCS